MSDEIILSVKWLFTALVAVLCEAKMALYDDAEHVGSWIYITSSMVETCRALTLSDKVSYVTMTRRFLLGRVTSH